MNIYIDIDDTICDKNGMDYSLAIPKYENIDKVNRLFDDGNNTIIMWTARGTMTGINWFETTHNQLIKWGVKFHELRMGKPAYDLLIDDKALNSLYSWTNDNVNKIIRTSKFSKSIRLSDDVYIGENHPCLIIAEIGQNHQGDINIAKQMIKIAKECGADVAKFQKSDLSAKFTRKALDRPYNSVNSFGKTYGDHKTFLEFSKEQYIELKQYADNVGILFAASPMDIPSIHFLDSINVPFFKVGSGDTNNLEYLEVLKNLDRPIILSTGMNDISNVTMSMDVLKDVENVCIMQCTSSYPLPDDQIHLNVMDSYKKTFDCLVGYSSHDVGTVVVVAAVAMGAKIVEKHFTLNKSWKGSDHSASLEPDELKEMCLNIRRIEKAMGNPTKMMQSSEKPCYNKLGKKLVSKKRIKKGDILCKDNVTVKVNDVGMDPINYFDVMGKEICRDIECDEGIELGDICI